MKKLLTNLGVCTFMLGLSLFMSPASMGQTQFIFGPTSGPGGASGSGYTVAPQKVVFWNDALGEFSDLGVNVTFSLEDQQYGPGLPGGVLEGGTPVNGQLGIAFGRDVNNANNNSPASVNRYNQLNGIGNPAASHLYSPPNSQSIWVNLLADALITSSGNKPGVVKTQPYYFGQLKMTFKDEDGNPFPVSNPIVNIAGLGGWTSPSGMYVGYSVGMQLVENYNISLALNQDETPTASPFFTINSTTRTIENSSPFFHSDSQGTTGGNVSRSGASGSIVVNGTNITELTFNIYLNMDDGRRDSGGWTTPPGEDDPPFATSSQVSGDSFNLSVMFERADVTVSGNVFNDPDRGFVNNSSGVANLIPSGIFANLIDTGGNVIASTAVATDGAYTFGTIPDIYTGSGYKVVLTNTAGIAGNPPPTPFTPPAGWEITGSWNGTPNTGNTYDFSGSSADFSISGVNIENINFGIAEACFIPANTVGEILDTEVGISALGRDAFNPDGWPQLRKGAWIALEAHTKGFVPNRLTTAQRDEIPSAQLVSGMMIYNITDDCLQINVDGTATGWHCFKGRACSN